MDYNGVMQHTQGQLSTLMSYLSFALGIKIMLGSLFYYLFSNIVIIVRDIALNTQKVETGEDYKAARFAADILVFASMGGFVLGLIILIRSL